MYLDTINFLLQQLITNGIIDSIRNVIKVDPFTAGILLIVGIFILGIVYTQIDKVLSPLFSYLDIDLHPYISQFKFPTSVTVGLFLIGISLPLISMTDKTQQLIYAVLLTILVLVWTRNTMKLSKFLVKKYVSLRYGEDLAPIVGNVLTVLVFGLSISLIFAIWGINIAPLLASAGVLGIIIGLAARDTIANFFGSLSLYADDTYRKGDFIHLNDDTRGIVWDISVRSTQIQTLDGDLITIPNSKLNNTIVRNKSTPQDPSRIRISFGVSYDSDPDHVKEIATQIINNSEYLESQPKPFVHLREFGDSAIHFEILGYIDHPRQKIRAEDEINNELYEKLSESGIKIPFPQRDIHIKKDIGQSENNQSSNSESNPNTN